jgi:hypothetical protein
MSGRRPAIKGEFGMATVAGAVSLRPLIVGSSTDPDVCPLICLPIFKSPRLLRRQCLGLGRLCPVVSHHLMVSRDCGALSQGVKLAFRSWQRENVPVVMTA